MTKPIHLSILIKFYLLFCFSGYSQNAQISEFEPSIFEGSTVIENLYSPSLEGNLLGDSETQPIRIFLPPGYDLYPKNRYPVLYILNGYEHDYNQFLDIGLLDMLDDMVANKIITPMIVVTPNGYNKYAGCMYTNSYVTGNWEDYIVQDVNQHVDGNYRTLNQRESRGLSGHSMGGYGAMLVGMKHPSVYSSIATICAANLDLEVAISHAAIGKEHFISAVNAGKYNSNLDWKVQYCFAEGVAFAPDSTAPALCRFPFDKYGNRIDSTWQEWNEHYLAYMLPTHRDSLLKLNKIQIYIGSDDPLVFEENKSFHLQLLDEGIEHGYEVFSGEHNPQPTLNDLLSLFSEQLIVVVPDVRSSSDYYIENSDTLVTETNKDATLYVVPSSAGYGIDSIKKYQIASVEVQANEEGIFILQQFEYGKYQVYAISQDSMVSNIPAEFVVVPDKSPPQLDVVSTRITKEDSIRVSMSRDGKMCLVAQSLWFPDTLRTASDIMNSSGLVESVDAPADSEISFSTHDLSPRTYWLYGIDQYGIVTGPLEVEVTPVGIPTNIPPEISLYPNPTNHILTLETGIYGHYVITITSLSGQLLLSKEMEGTTHQLDLSSFQKGVYFITIRSQDFLTKSKIIKL